MFKPPKKQVPYMDMSRDKDQIGKNFPCRYMSSDNDRKICVYKKKRNTAQKSL